MKQSLNGKPYEHEAEVRKTLIYIVGSIFKIMARDDIFPDMIERRHVVLQIIASAIFMAIAVSIISSSLVEIMNIVNISLGLRIALSILIIVGSTLWLTNYYLGETITIDFSMPLLVNKDTGEFYPLDYFPAFKAFEVSKIFKQKALALTNNININDPNIRDLIEWILLRYILEIHSTKIVSPIVGRASPVLSPSPMSFVDISRAFEDNIFVKEAKNYWQDNEFHALIPTGVVIKRGTPENNTISAESAVILRGKLLTPLDFLSITATVVGIQFEAPMSLLYLIGCTPRAFVIGETKIICKEREISGKEAEELMKWAEIRCIVTVRYKMRGWLFFHPKFRDWYHWAQDLVSHAKTHFDFETYLEERNKR
ncbi:hypothetical protein E3E38_08945 [Thermococcus sp. 18S1]|uniref:hypothetical protein n=1 Tax=Thermococcus sp. 18S1 TaxID=1638210 RepID=UPI001438C582|nr:hypothetical protein [Thermococcus sp. 18S1]NJE31168.1 hypothetical protein [Thermococcus sp. 18S1]